ncbi:SET domain-containing protein 4 [Tachyglossus aculeatus]|uniref:SET domain-containing protein 4 n=1 Tax=Tachyglossus aculeatus TaxID=9261 RepID=UPI0018F30693|nr:SET domain-containing protein 4 [Tachyglossus aculeatus]
MSKGRGRTSRCRKRKRNRTSEPNGVNESHQLEFIELKKWLKGRRFGGGNLRPARFPGTGRGLMATKSLKAGEMIISLPEACLLTTDTVLRSPLGDYIWKWRPPVSPLLALCTFLVAERRAGARSPWQAYLGVLPRAYTCPVGLDAAVLGLLPRPLERRAREQRAAVRELWAASGPFFSSLQPLFSEDVEQVFTQDALAWAWCTLNTRTVYMERAQRGCFSPGADVYALAPYLDLLNHGSGAQVEAAFNQETRCYEIRTSSPCRKYEEVLICYGPHDNRRLLLEYGFVCSNNPHSNVVVSPDVLVRHLPSGDKQMTKKLSLLKEHGFLENLTFGWDGPSWRLLTALKLLRLGADEFTNWKRVLLGEVISEANETKSLALAETLCSYFLEETRAGLQKISQMKGEEVVPRNQLELVEALRLEELEILKVSAEVVESLQRARAPRGRGGLR